MARKSAVARVEETSVQTLSVVNNRLKIRPEDLKQIEPLTENQRKFFELYDNTNVLLLHGVAGTGKTYIALYKALKDVLDKGNCYKKVIIVRSDIVKEYILARMSYEEKYGT